MTARTKWIGGVACAMMVFATVVYYASQFFATVAGVASSIADVPRVGKLLPEKLAVKDIQFRSYGMAGDILLRATASENDFDAIVTHWQTNAVRYESGFRYPGGVTETDFRPDAGRMYVADRKSVV